MKLAYLNALRAVEATVRLGTIKLAAEELGVTTAAVGQQIRGLEDYLGRPLFHRHSTGVQPTEELGRLAPRLGTAMNGLADVFRDLHTAEDPNRISVTMTPALAENWLSGELSGFFRMSEGADFRIHVSQTAVDFSSGDFDFAIRSTAEPGDEFTAKWLFPTGVVPICTPDFAQTHGLSPDRIDIAGIPLCHVRFGTDHTLWGNWEIWCENFGFEFPGKAAPRLLTFNGGLRLESVKLGLTLGGLMESLPMLRDGTAVMPFGPRSVFFTDRSFWLLSLKARRLSATQRMFSDWLLDRVASAREEMQAQFGDMPGNPALGT